MNRKFPRLSGFLLALALMLAFSGFAANALAGINDDLLSAAKAGNVKEVSRLLPEGADVNARDKEGKTPLAYGIDKKRDAVAEVIRQHAGQ